MILLDTDHVTVLKYPESVAHAALTARMAASEDRDFAVTVVTVEEQTRGWLAEIARAKRVRDQIGVYRRLAEIFAFFSNWKIVTMDAIAVDRFDGLRRQKIRVGTMDLKIAAIALANNALLLTANRRDFGKVRGLRAENWMV